MSKTYDLIMHSYKSGFIAEANIEKSSTGKFTDYELIFIVDRSGSMSSSYPILINKIIPYLLDKLKFPENKKTHFITFEDYVDYRRFSKKDFLDCREPAPGAIEKMTDIFPQLRKIFIPQNEKTPMRILTLSDGEIVVAEERRRVPILASELSEEIRGKFRINSQAIRYFTSSAQPDTLALASVLQLNTVKESTLIDIDYREPHNVAGDKIYELFKDDGFDCNLKIKANRDCIKPNPWTEVKEEIPLFIGKNFFWVDNYDEKTEFKLKINDEEEVKMNIIKGEDINISNYGVILASKISEYLNKLKVLKIVNCEKSQKEIEQIVQNFKQFEDSLEKTEEEEIALKDGKMASRLIYLQKLINKRKGLVSNQMDVIKNEERLAQFNSQQKADYLRCVDNTKLGKSLAKRALNTEDLYGIVFKEIDELSNCIDIDEIDYSSHPSSFYSTCTTVESLNDIKNLVKEPIYRELQVAEVLKLINIVGIACNGKVGEYPDPSVYLVKNIYPGCYISMADIVTAEEYSKGKEHLAVPGTKEEINNCIPIFSDEKVYEVLKKAPKILELFAGLGMRRVIADIPLTFESLILSGLWKMIGILKGKKSEINIKCFGDICTSMKYAIGQKYNNVIDTIKQQLGDKDNKTKKNGLYINSYGLFQMLPVLYECAKNNTFSKEELQKIYRAIARFEIYKLIRGKIRKAEKKEELIKESLNAALGIDFEKYGTKLPELFQKKVDPEFHDDFHINKDVVKEYLKVVGWTQLIPYSYMLFSALLKPDSNVNENMKNMKEYTFKDVKEEFGIQFDYDKFLIFNVVQSLVYKEKIDRENENDKVMKIMDSNDEKEVDTFLKDQAKHIYAAQYNLENQKQIKKQFEIISKELNDKLISSKDLSEFNELMRKGITKGYLTHKILNDSTKGYIDLKKSILDEKIDVPLRYEKLKAILSGKDEKGEDLWNNGNAIRTHRKDYQVFIKKNNPNLWEELSKLNMDHKYRAKENRQGHSNTKKSYWAKGYDTLQAFYELSKKDEVDQYKKEHTTCCGLSAPGKSLKDAKKLLRKQKRKEFREKKKNSSESTKKKDDKKKEEEENDIRGRGRGSFRGRYRGYRGRVRRRHIVRSIPRGRGRGGSMSPMDFERDYGEEEYGYDEEMMELDEKEEGKIPIGGGKKKKKAEKKIKKKEKEEKKLNKKINRLMDEKK